MIKNYKRTLVISDMHCDHHHVPTLRTALEISRFIKPDLVIFNGDCTNNEAISKHKSQKGMHTGRLKDQIEPCIRVIHAFDDTSKQTKIVLGNHDFWIQRAREGENPDAWEGIPTNGAPAIFQSLGLRKRIAWKEQTHFDHGIWLGDWWRAGFLINHGDKPRKMMGVGTVNPARNMLLKGLGVPMGQSHLHSKCETVYMSAFGRLRSGASFPCACEEFDYNIGVDSIRGLGFVEQWEDDSPEIQTNVFVIPVRADGTTAWAGRIWTGQTVKLEDIK